jgi:hypothetical protein
MIAVNLDPRQADWSDLRFATMEPHHWVGRGFSWPARKRAMLKISSVVAIGGIVCAILQPATAQTPGAAAAEKSGSATSLNPGTVPLKPTRVAPPASFSKSARPAGLMTSRSRNAGKTAAAMRSQSYANVRTNRSARSAAAAFAFLPARAAPQERARTASARRKALRNLPTSAVLPKKPKSG